MGYLRTLLSGALLFVFVPTVLGNDRLSPLAPKPDWSELDAYQETITREEFLRLLTAVYARDNDFRPFIQIASDRALVQMESGRADRIYELRFSPGKEAAQPVPRYWKPAGALPRAPTARPLSGLVIALDPGHIGGEFAQMEERWFKIGQGRPVMEGDMTLIAARHLERILKAFGAKVVWVRDSNKPVTRVRPKSLRKEALKILQQTPGPVHESYSGRDDPRKTRSIQWQSELLFYRASEIRARAIKVNRQLKPDLTLCLHFNAEAWGNPSDPQLVDLNHLHLLINGAYSRGEMSLDDVRFEMLLRLLNRVYPEELAVSESVAESLAQATGLPPYTYTGGNAFRAGASPYVWGRNLLANRLYLNPVIYLEPFVMNSHAVYARVQAGDYEGKREFGGQMRESIYREYARGVAEGLLRYYRETRGGGG